MRREGFQAVLLQLSPQLHLRLKRIAALDNVEGGMAGLCVKWLEEQYAKHPKRELVESLEK